MAKTRTGIFPSIKDKDRMNSFFCSRQGRTTRAVYIIESALDNCICAMAAGVFLTILLKRIGISDSLTGIITNLSTLACTMQMFAYGIAQKYRSVKRFVLSTYMIYHLLFLMLYVLPFLNLSRSVQITLFIVCYLGGHMLNSVIYPNKFNWLMSYVPENQHGGFTANREIIVLISGMIFNYGMSAWVDRLNASGRTDTSLLLCGATIALFSLLHLTSLSYASDAPCTSQGTSKQSFFELWKLSFADKKFRILLPVAIIYTAALCFSTSFYTVYQLQELHFSLKYIAFLTIAGAVARALVSRLLGRYADTRGWAKALTLAFSLYALGFLVNCFAVPKNGHWIFLIYTLLVSLGGAITGTGIHTIIFAYIPASIRTTSLGIYSAAGGIFGFLASLIGGAIIDWVQKNNNLLFGHTFYAQQVTTVITFCTLICLIFYMIFVVSKMKTLHQEEAEKVVEPA